ncbi:hypothetical protein MKX03_010544, partial [Papaver bracteatum]
GLVMLTLSVSTLIPLKFQYWDGVPLYEEENPDAAGLASKGQILAHTNQLKCLDKATIMDRMDTSRLCAFGLGVYIAVSRCYSYKKTVADLLV